MVRIISFDRSDDCLVDDVLAVLVLAVAHPHLPSAFSPREWRSWIRLNPWLVVSLLVLRRLIKWSLSYFSTRSCTSSSNITFCSDGGSFGRFSLEGSRSLILLRSNMDHLDLRLHHTR